MPARMEKLKQEIRERKPNKDTLFMYKRIQEQTKVITEKPSKRGVRDYDDDEDEF